MYYRTNEDRRLAEEKYHHDVAASTGTPNADMYYDETDNLPTPKLFQTEKEHWEGEEVDAINSKFKE